ncbi:cyanophycin synthetase [Virgisporangium aliadipatigenens]|uniref:Cyanophycin synthetase n=1 Tax=Virgisporangium aliadipatigenens TaxID=741659 RepID=A0A8J3YG63_9ACTN|nr:cyanophycin synthetase [Virgisporangium aliadipatigenens]GIJ44599.1 cyanophycin synthetase [Virgisporangium aliadipatigenens]
MRIEHTRRLRGPNVYLERPVMVARVNLDGFTERESTDVPGLAERLLATLPGLAEHHCASGAPGGFVRRLREGTYFGHIAEHVAIELSVRIDRRVNFGRTVYADAPGVYDVITECPVDEPPDSELAEDLLCVAIDLVTGRQREPRLDGLAERWERLRPGPTTDGIARAARARGIPVERVGALSLLRLGYGRHRRLVWAAMTDGTSAVGVDIAGDKELTRRILGDAAVPVPEGGTARTVEEALAIHAALGGPVVVKPRHGRQGSHVYLGLTSAEAVRAAFDAASADGEVVLERQLTGRDYRVLVVGGHVIAAAERLPAHVVGDGDATLAELVERANADPLRGSGHGRALTRLRLDEVAAALLERQGHTPASVPAAGETVWLRDNANLSTGGTARDVTERLHPDVIDLCRRTVEIVGLDIAGIDLRLPDVAAPLPPCGTRVDGGVIEVNAAPGLRMHLSPTEGRPRDVAGAVVGALYPPGAPTRIPTVAVTGTNGKTTVARLIAHLLGCSGLRVGLTSTDGVYVGGRMVQRADATGPRSAHVVLSDPTVEAAVLETARGGILRQGLGYDVTDVGVVTNLAADHLGQDGVRTLDDLVHVKSLVAERVRDGGALVLNADDPRVRDLISRPRVRAAHKRLLWFGLSPSPLVHTHVENGGTAYVLVDGMLVERTRGRETPLIALERLPGSFGGAARYAAANALAAAAAARGLGVPAERVAAGLAAFDPADGNPGRGQLYTVDGRYVLVDYAHNPAAIDAVGELLHGVWGPERCVAAVTLPGDRSDELIADCARAVADRFGRVVLYEDTDPRGRAPGELPALVRDGIAARRPDAEVTVLRTVEEALPAALAVARAGDVVLLLYERFDAVAGLLDALDAGPVADVTHLLVSLPVP